MWIRVNCRTKRNKTEQNKLHDDIFLKVCYSCKRSCAKHLPHGEIDLCWLSEILWWNLTTFHGSFIISFSVLHMIPCLTNCNSEELVANIGVSLLKSMYPKKQHQVEVTAIMMFLKRVWTLQAVEVFFLDCLRKLGSKENEIFENTNTLKENQIKVEK